MAPFISALHIAFGVGVVASLLGAVVSASRGRQAGVRGRGPVGPAGRSMTSLRRGLTAFRHRNYRLFFTGQAISLVGTWMQQVAQAWLVLIADPRSAVAGRRGRRPVPPGPGLRPVRRRPGRHAPQATDAPGDPGDQDEPVDRPWRWSPRPGYASDPAAHPPGARHRDRQRGRHAGPPVVRGRDGRPRGHRQRGRPQFGDVQRSAGRRSGGRRADDRRGRCGGGLRRSTRPASWP